MTVDLQSDGALGAQRHTRLRPAVRERYIDGGYAGQGKYCTQQTGQQRLHTAEAMAGWNATVHPVYDRF